MTQKSILLLFFLSISLFAADNRSTDRQILNDLRNQVRSLNTKTNLLIEKLAKSSRDIDLLEEQNRMLKQSLANANQEIAILKKLLQSKNEEIKSFNQVKTKSGNKESGKRNKTPKKTPVTAAPTDPTVSSDHQSIPDKSRQSLKQEAEAIRKEIADIQGKLGILKKKYGVR